MRALLLGLLLLGCASDTERKLIGEWVPDLDRDPAIVALQGEARAKALAFERSVGDRRLKFAQGGTLTIVVGPLVQDAAWKVTSEQPLTIETVVSLGAEERATRWKDRFEGDSMSAEDETGLRLWYTRAGT